MTPRVLLLSFVLGLLSVFGPLAAQPESRQPLPPGAREIAMRNFAVCFLFAPNVPEIYFRTPTGEYNRLQIDTVRFSAWNVIPATNSLELYRRIITPPTKSLDPKKNIEVLSPEKISYELAQTWELRPGLEPLRRLFYYSSNGAIQQFDFESNATIHGPLHARVINLLSQQAGVIVGKERQMVGPGREVILKAPSALNEVFGFQYALEQPDRPAYVSPLQNLRFSKPEQRLTILLGYMPVTHTSDTGVTRIIGYNPDAIRFHENLSQLPPAPKPVIIMPRAR